MFVHDFMVSGGYRDEPSGPQGGPSSLIAICDEAQPVRSPRTSVGVLYRPKRLIKHRLKILDCKDCILMFQSLNLGGRDTSRLEDDASGLRAHRHVFVCL